MDGEHRADAPWLIPLNIGEASVKTAKGKKEPSAFLRWLDHYFLSTPADRMHDEYNAYWH